VPDEPWYEPTDEPPRPAKAAKNGEVEDSPEQVLLRRVSVPERELVASDSSPLAFLAFLAVDPN